MKPMSSAPSGRNSQPARGDGMVGFGLQVHGRVDFAAALRQTKPIWLMVCPHEHSETTPYGATTNASNKANLAAGRFGTSRWIGRGFGERVASNKPNFGVIGLRKRLCDARQSQLNKALVWPNRRPGAAGPRRQTKPIRLEVRPTEAGVSLRKEQPKRTPYGVTTNRTNKANWRDAHGAGRGGRGVGQAEFLMYAIWN